MKDILTALAIIFVAYVLFKIFAPSKVPDYKVCSGDKCWSTKRSNANQEKTYTPREDPHAVAKVELPEPTNAVDKTEQSQQDDVGAMIEVFTNPKDFKDIRATLKQVADADDLTLNYRVKYSK
jgi:hypothetical protein